MNSIQKENPLGYEKLPRLLKSFAVPSIIAMLVSSLYNIVDQVFIGQGVGYLGNAATNVAFPLTTISLAIALLIGIGSASLFSLNLGAGEKEDAVQVVGTAFTMMLVFGVIYAVLIEIFLVPLLTAFGATAEIMPYAKEYTRITAIGMPFLIVNNGMSNLARADGSPKFSMTCMLIGAIINTILDPVFIFIFKLGVAGAAWATIIGQIVSCLVAVSYLKRFRNVELKAHYFRLHRKLCLKIASLGMSNSLNQVALTFVQIVLNNTLSHYGAQSVYGGDIPLACAGIITKVNMIFMSFVIGISQGIQPIIGFNYGAEKYERVRKSYLLALGTATVLSGIAFFCFQVFPRQIISVFGSGSELYFQFSERYFRIYMFLTLINGIQPVTSNFFNSIGKSQLGVFMSLTRQILFLLPLIMIFPLFMGIDGVMYAGPIADAAAAIVCGYFMVRELKELSVMDKKKKEESAALS